MPHVSRYVFLLGLACGIACLTMTAYRRVSPRWLRWVLMASGLLMVSRYVTMALLTQPDAPTRYWAFRACWFASTVGLTLPSVFAVDQLVKHPAMTPKKLLAWWSPLLAIYLGVMLFGDFTPRVDPWGVTTLGLGAGWRNLHALTHSIYVLLFVGISAQLILKIPMRSVRIALLGLVAAHLALAADGVMVTFGGGFFRPFLYSEMATLLAIWYAHETGTSL